MIRVCHGLVSDMGTVGPEVVIWDRPVAERGELNTAKNRVLANTLSLHPFDTLNKHPESPEGILGSFCIERSSFNIVLNGYGFELEHVSVLKLPYFGYLGPVQWGGGG